MGDRIEHYCRCRVVQDCCCRLLRLDPTTHASLHAFVLASPALMHRETLALQGLLIYGTYSAVNSIRFKVGHKVTPTVSYDAICQSIREGARGHSFSLKVLHDRWSPNHETLTRMQAPPLLPYSNRVKRMRALGHQTRRVRARLTR